MAPSYQCHFHEYYVFAIGRIKVYASGLRGKVVLRKAHWRKAKNDATRRIGPHCLISLHFSRCTFSLVPKARRESPCFTPQLFKVTCIFLCLAQHLCSGYSAGTECT